VLDLLSLSLLGLLLGVRHATDADHVVAVTTVVSRQRSLPRAAAVGALWGVGHTVTILLVGGAILLLRLSIPPRMGLAMEFAVALMLIGLGVYNLIAHAPSPARETPGVRPVLVGMVHGLAGSAAVALLVVAAVDDPRWGVAYLLVFGLGTVLGMMLVTVVIALPALWAAGRVTSFDRWLRLASGAASVVFGLVLAHQIGVTDGLFGTEPRWNPH
jgi:high-affinity nickel-transport protein